MSQEVHRVHKNPAKLRSMSITWQKSESVMYMGIPPFGGLAACTATKEFSSWEEPSAWKPRADRLPFMADSRGEVPARVL